MVFIQRLSRPATFPASFEGDYHPSVCHDIEAYTLLTTAANHNGIASFPLLCAPSMRSNWAAISAGTLSFRFLALFDLGWTLINTSVDAFQLPIRRATRTCWNQEYSRFSSTILNQPTWISAPKWRPSMHLPSRYRGRSSPTRWRVENTCKEAD